MEEEKKSMYRYSIILIIFALIIVFIIQSGILEEIYRYIKSLITQRTNINVLIYNIFFL